MANVVNNLVIEVIEFLTQFDCETPRLVFK